MRLTGLQPVVRADGPYASVCLDVSRTTENAEHELQLRWRAVSDSLRSDGAPDGVVERLASRVLEPTEHGGTLQRYAVAADDGIAVDSLGPGPIAQPEYAHYGPLPHLMPLARMRTGRTPYILVKVDHTGADIVCADSTGLDVEHSQSEGDHDVVHKVPGGGWSHRRFQSRVEDSWERNGEQVAEDVHKVALDHPGPVLLVGEPHARSIVRTYATGRLAARLTDLGHGSRAAGSSDDALDERVAAELAGRREARRTALLERYREQVGRGDGVATNLTEVLRALREGSLETLLLVDRPDSTERLWTGSAPTQVARSADELTSLGSDAAVEDRADEVVVRALVDLDGDLELLDEGTDLLPDGIGGMLRFDTGRVRS
jgi:Bacterial archaeo-eukaryotic release factor family 2